MNKLNIYTNILPNYQDSTYYYFKDKSKYLSEISSNLLKTIDVNNYRLNEDSAFLKVDSVLSIENYEKITYLIEYNTENDYFKCFYVNYSEYQSGYVHLTLKVDFWGSFIYKTNFSNLLVSRCNRNIGNGVYDSIKLVSTKEIEDLASVPSDNGGLYILASIMFATGKSSILVNNASTTLRLYAFKVDQTSSTFNLKSLINELSGIYSAKATIGDLDASVLRLYIVPDLTFYTTPEDKPIFNSKTENGTYELTPDYTVLPYTITKTFNITIDANYKYIAGTLFDGIELINTTNDTKVYYDYTTSYDGLKVCVRQGDKSKDITNDFECSITTNEGNLTLQEKINKSLSLLGGLAMTVANPSTAPLTASLAVANTFNNLTFETNGRVIGSGNGMASWIHSQFDTTTLINKLKNGLVLQKYKSAIDEKENADVKGCIFNKLIEFENIFNSKFVGTNNDGLTYIQATCNINNLQVDVMQAIQNALINGIRCKNLNE
jgi:hypothetical protein